MQQTEVYILSGFLGSGKTTLLKRLLQNEKEQGRKVAVLMNELGSISIDTDAVEEDIPLKELLDGCICCTIQDKLESALQALLFDDQPDCIYIETTGAAHPVETLDAILSPLFANQLLIKGIITVIDGTRWLARKAYSPQIQQLILEQVRHADLLIINKADELTEREQADITLAMQALNQKTLPILTTYSKVGMKEVRKLIHHTTSNSQKSHVVADLQLSTFVYTFTKPVKQAEFENWLMKLPDTIYRMKGYLKFEHSKSPYLFQFSYGMPMYMKEDMNMPLNLVFIGEQVNWSDIHEELKQLEEKSLDGTKL